ncbi:hypothetical protein LABALGNA3A7_08890 [Dellaglioa algida]|nr:hypothetical protein LABALGNA3A7_08890 [Dellaglioa algida]
METILYLIMAILIIYNIKLSLQLTKVRQANVRSVDSLGPEETKILADYAIEKRKWQILGNVLFSLALVCAFIGTTIETSFFVTLYVVTMIAVNRSRIRVNKLLQLDN